MRKRIVNVVLVAVAAVAAGLFFRTPQPVAGAQGALKVAVIDLNRVVGECQMGKDGVREIEAASKERRDDLEKQMEEIKKLGEELKLLDTTSEEAIHKTRIVTEKQALLNAQVALARSEMGMKFAAAHKAIYTEIFKVLEEFRKANGYDLLLRKDALNLEELDPLSVSALLRSNAVLCADPQMDVSDKIIKILDERYAKKK